MTCNACTIPTFITDVLHDECVLYYVSLARTIDAIAQTIVVNTGIYDLNFDEWLACKLVRVGKTAYHSLYLSHR